MFPRSEDSKLHYNFWKFLLPSLLGVMLFLFPINSDGHLTIPVAAMAKSLNQVLTGYIQMILLVVILVSAMTSIIVSLFTSKSSTRSSLRSLFSPSLGWLFIRVLGGFFIFSCFFKVGPSWIYNSNTGLLVLNELLPILFCVFIFAGFLLPLLLDFGLLEFVGTLATKIMRPLFNLPGRSAVDCLTSWLGDGSVGVMLTAKQYEQGYYTQKESAIIATNFSAVSITFALVVLAQVSLESDFILFYSAVCLSSLSCALILPRIPPLSFKKPIYIDGTNSVAEIAEGDNLSLHKKALNLAVMKASQLPHLSILLKKSCFNVAEMVFGLLPVVMAIGTIALSIAEFTPLFEYLGKPFIPLLEILHIAEPVKASEAILVGFADMFVPSIIVSGIENDMTRFVIAALSITQLIYLSEVGALILGSKIPLNLLELLIIFILRTLITLPILALMGHLFLV